MNSQVRMMRTLQMETKFTGGTTMKTQRHIVSGLLLGFVLFAVAQTAAAQVDLYNNTNGDAVRNAPGGAPAFNLSVPTRITELVTYHWNYGLGSTPGFLAISRQNGQIVGRFQARGTSGQNGVANVNWIATPNLVLPAGKYILIDSNVSTWSTNARSGFVGFGIVRGSAVSVPGPVAPPSPADRGSNSFSTATPLIPVASMPVAGPNLLAQRISDGIGGGDPNDWYFLNVSGPNGFQQARSVAFALTGFTGNVQLVLYAYEQIRQPFPNPPVQAGQVIAVGGPAGSATKVISLSLLPGNYAVRVMWSGAPTNYTLTISTPAR